MIPWTDRMVTTLAPDEVFVFGSNCQGFHGAGAAGLAMRGDSRNNWRQDKRFLAAMNGPPGSDLRNGKWATYGKGKGFQAGSDGASYAIATVTRPGARQSIPRREIYYQLVGLWGFARNNPELTFLITPLGEGYAGWSQAEMNEVWEYLVKAHGLPSKVQFIGRSAGIAAT